VINFEKVIDLENLRDVSAVIHKEFSVETVTPLLMHGWQEKSQDKDGRQRNMPINAEVRPPSLKGMLRFWWRALQYHIESLEKLFSEETLLFGGAGDKEITRRSSIIIQIDQPKSTITNRNQLLPHKGSNVGFVPGINAEESFAVQISVLKKDKTKLDKFIDLMKWSIIVGSFGQRSNRGFGSLKIVGERFEAVDQYLNEVIQLFERLTEDQIIERDATSYSLYVRKLHNRWPLFHSLTVGRSYSTFKEALIAINQASHEVAKNFNGALGSINPRRPSPLRATVRRIGEKYYPVIVIITYPKEQYPNFASAAKEFCQKVGGEGCQSIFS